MIELEPRDFERIRPLVPPSNEAGHMAFVHAVIEGSMPGFALTDAAASPSSAIVANLSGFWFAIGEPLASLAAEAAPTLRARRPPEEPTGLWCTTVGWEALLDPWFSVKEQRHEFHPPPPGTTAPSAGREGFRLGALDHEAARQLAKGGGLDPWIARIWGGPEELVRRSFGTCVWKGDDIVGFCAACAIERGGEAEIEIGTAPEFRGLGLAEMAGRAFIAECEGRGLQPAWTCAITNETSGRLARRLGFRYFRTVAGYPLP